MPPLVSVCIPTYGRAKFLGRVIQSILRQTYEHFELIVVDDHSPDDTADVAGAISDPRYTFIRNETNLGVPANYNRLFALATGEFVVLVEDHDLLDPTYLEKVVQVFNRNPAVGFVGTGLETIDDDDRRVRGYVQRFPEVMPSARILRRLLTRTTCPVSLTVVIRRALLHSLDPPFEPRYWWYGDQSLWMKLASVADFGYVAEPLLKFRTREADHPLADQIWESLLCVDQIHQDNWRLLHPRRGLAAARDALQYEFAKLYRVAQYRVSRIVQNRRPWDEKDRENTARYLSSPSRALVAAVGAVPTGAWKIVHGLAGRATVG
jgi:glycosyltransferase involved in cell wall biosynthesis